MPRHAKHTKTARIFGAQLKRRRLALGLTQEEYAHRSSIDISFISRVERGLTQPSVGVLVQMAKHLDITATEMIRELEANLHK